MLNMSDNGRNTVYIKREPFRMARKTYYTRGMASDSSRVGRFGLRCCHKTSGSHFRKRTHNSRKLRKMEERREREKEREKKVEKEVASVGLKWTPPLASI